MFHAGQQHQAWRLGNACAHCWMSPRPPVHLDRPGRSARDIAAASCRSTVSRRSPARRSPATHVTARCVAPLPHVSPWRRRKKIRPATASHQASAARPTPAPRARRRFRHCPHRNVPALAPTPRKLNLTAAAPGLIERFGQRMHDFVGHGAAIERMGMTDTATNSRRATSAGSSSSASSVTRGSRNRQGCVASA